MCRVGTVRRGGQRDCWEPGHAEPVGHWKDFGFYYGGNGSHGRAVSRGMIYALGYILKRPFTGFKLLRLRFEVLYILVLSTDPDPFLVALAAPKRSHFSPCARMFPIPGASPSLSPLPTLLWLASPLLIFQHSAQMPPRVTTTSP